MVEHLLAKEGAAGSTPVSRLLVRSLKFLEIKVSRGSTPVSRLPLPRVNIDGVVWHLDVGSSHPGAVVRSKGWAVRPLKRYASWVQNVVRQFGPYLSQA